jgi:hypothetical protein
MIVLAVVAFAWFSGVVVAVGFCQAAARGDRAAGYVRL